jgi:hypothetical protein
MSQLVKWEREKVKEAIEKVRECSIISTTEFEGYVTDGFYVRVKDSDNSLWIRGFRCDGIEVDMKDPYIEMIEVTTGYSDGDMPQDPALCIAHGHIKAELMRIGYRPVNSLDPYF